jgi:hypothetical protein
MSRMGHLLVTCLVAVGGLAVAGCEDDSAGEERTSIEAYLDGPGARLGSRVMVPEGATRIGPTIPIEQERDGRIVGRISLLQIDGDPDQVIQDLLAELGRRIPDAGVEPDKARRRCWLDDSHEWISQCRLLVAGHTPSGEPLQVDVTVTPTAGTDGEAIPGTTGRPQARVLVRLGTIREIGTNLDHPSGYPFSIRDQEAARWPTASETDGTVDRSIDTVPGADDWPVQPGGFPIGAVLSNPRYAVVAVDEGESVQDVATSYITAVPNTRLTTRELARVGQRTTTSYEIVEADGGPGAHLWAIDRPGTDYLFLRYWPPET